MLNYDLSPFYRSTVGFDRLLSMLDKAVGAEQNAPTYPPYNIERTGENAYRITLAVAGFGENELSVETRENTLTVRGSKEPAAKDEKARSRYIRASPRARSSAGSSSPTTLSRPARPARTGCSTSIWSARFRKRRSRAQSRSTAARRSRRLSPSRRRKRSTAVSRKRASFRTPFRSVQRIAGTSFSFDLSFGFAIGTGADGFAGARGAAFADWASVWAGGAPLNGRSVSRPDAASASAFGVSLVTAAEELPGAAGVVSADGEAPGDAAGLEA